MASFGTPAISVVKTVREQVSPEEWDARVNLAAAYRLVELFGMSDLTANHISYRLPDTPDHFLINPHGMLYDEVTASSLLTIDCDGNVIFNATDYGLNQAGFVIHSAIHMARKDLTCIAHTHTPAGMAVSALECGLMMVAQSGMRFNEIAYHDFEGVALDLDERQRLIRDLGDRDAMILRNHGLLVGAATIDLAFTMLYRLEQACQTQIMAMSCNTPLRAAAPESIAKTYARETERRKADPNAKMTKVGQQGWEALKRRLDRIDPSYKT